MASFYLGLQKNKLFSILEAIIRYLVSWSDTLVIVGKKMAYRGLVYFG
jgi:hypothetical protein